MKYVRNIFTVLMVTVFLVPAAGIYYTRHSCEMTGEDRIVIDRDYSCCDVETSHCTVDEQNGKSCCSEPAASHESVKDSKKECCSNDGTYLKTQDDYTFSGKSSLSNIEIQLTIANILFQPSTKYIPGQDFIIHPPPKICSSRHVLIQHGVFLI